VKSSKPSSNLWLYADGMISPAGSVPYRLITSVENKPGIVLLGTNGGGVIEWVPESQTNREIVAGLTAPVWDRLTAFCSLSGQSGLFIGDSDLYLANFSGSRAAAITLIQREGPDWTGCAALRGSEALLLQKPASDLVYDDDALEDNVSKSQEGRLSVIRIRAIGGGGTILPIKCATPCVEAIREISTSAKLPGWAWALGSRHIYLFSAEDRTLRRILEIPAVVRGRMHLSVDPGGFWLATEQFGAWRWAGDPMRPSPSAEERWKSYDEVDGLPSEDVRAVVPRSEREAVFVTAGGVVKGNLAGKSWAFDPGRQYGITGSSIRAAAMFESKQSLSAAVSTEEGVSVGIARRDSSELDEFQWSALAPSLSLERARLRNLAWCGQQNQLWIAVDNSVVVYQMGSPTCALEIALLADTYTSWQHRAD
jgi:hypothetical protein